MGSLLKTQVVGFRVNNKKFWALGLLLLVIGLIMIVPFLFMISASFKPQAMITAEPLKFIYDTLYTQNYIDAINFPNFLQWYFNSVWMVLTTIILRLIVVTSAAYAFARLKIPGKNIIFISLFSVWMIPPDTTIIARFLFIKTLHLYGSQWSVILNFTFDVFALFMLRQFFMKVPMTLSEAALIDGCSHFAVYYRIILPLTKPILVTMSLFTFIWVWNSFMEPYIFIDTLNKQTLTVGLQFFQSKGGVNIGMMLAGATLGTVPAVILFSAMQRYFIEGVASSGIKG